jgi:hypothetical protein
LKANREGDPRAALRFFLQARNLDRADPRYALSAANLYLRLGEPREAMPIYEEVLAETEPSGPNERYHTMAITKLVEAKMMAGRRGSAPVGAPDPVLQSRLGRHESQQEGVLPLDNPTMVVRPSEGAPLTLYRV